MNKRSPAAALLVMLLALFLFGGTAITLYTDWLWFQELGYTGVFRTVLFTRLALFAGGAALLFLLLAINVKIARRPGRTRRERAGRNVVELLDREQLEPLVRRVLPAALLMIAFMGGAASSSLWEEALGFLNPTSFKQTDPLFGLDVSFYVFRLPLIQALHSALFIGLGLCLVVSAVVHLYEGRIELSEQSLTVDSQAKKHLLTLAGLMLLVKAAGYRLDMFDLLHSPRGVAYGASFTDVHATLPMLKVLLVVAALCGVLVIISGFRGGWRPAGFALGGWLLASLIGLQLAPAAIQKLQVAPNELSKEQPYIEHNIRFTRAGYGLEAVQEEEFAAEDRLTSESLRRNNLTVENIRMMDTRPLLTAYQQLQEIRTYYDFNDVDVDRYTIDGRSRQVTLSAREISSERLPSKLWINEHLTYTHGYGAVVSPVNRITREGLPDFLLKNIPPTGHKDLKLDRPEIYYGERLNEYVFVKTKAREFNYPSGDQNVYSTYDGTGGVPAGGFGRRLAFALRFQSLPVLLNSDITPESRLLFYRRIQDRLSRIAPFLEFDPDPYLVINQGRLFWMCDAYTLTSRFPYSQPLRGAGNYIRNSVKVVVDAYNGTVSFYIADANDPLIRTYARIFPGLFQPLDKMDPGMRRHLRYPQRLFEIQSRMYAVYHMTDPQVFYNKEDIWEIPAGDPGTTPFVDNVSHSPSMRGRLDSLITESGTRRMEPYYTIMKLPDSEKEEFIQLIPFTPASKDNLRAWMCARIDPPHYGKLLVYNFPKAKLVYGPSQINARIEQDAHISQQLALWRQSGIDAIRGNLLIIPIDQSLLYVQPLYLKAAQGEIPELKRVVVAYGDRIAMETDLLQSLATLFGRGSVSDSVAAARTPARATMAPTPTNAGASSGGQRELAREALQRLRRARESYRNDDWARFGEELKALEAALQRLSEQEE